MKKPLIIIIGIVSLILAVVYIPKKIQSLKEQFVTEFIQDKFKEDILFLAEVMPAFCIEDEVLIKYMFDEAYLSANYDIGMEQKNVLIIGFLEEFSRGLIAARPQNDFHRALKKNMIAHFEKHKIAELTLESVDARIEELYVFFTSLEGVLEESKAEAYFSQKFVDDNKVKEEKPTISEDKSSQWFSGKLDVGTLDAGVIAIHSIATENPNYKVAYENGCMKNFMEGLKYFILSKSQMN